MGSCATMKGMALSIMNLPRGGYPPEILNKRWQDWSPQEAESVRLHFLAPLLHLPQYAKLNLEGAVIALRMLTPFSPEEKVLEHKAILYSQFHNSPTHFSTVSAPSMAAD